MFVIIYLNNIWIYTDDDGYGYVVVIQFVLKQIRKFLLFANLKKWSFHQEEIWLFGYLVSSKGIRMEDQRIKVVKQ